MTTDDRDTIERATRLRRIMNEFITTMTPQQRDRVMQVHLAQARGPVRNGDLLRQAVDRALRIRAAQSTTEGSAPMDDALIATLTEVVEALEQAHVTYAITGSVATSVYGEPYSSLDAEIVAGGSVEQAASLSAKLSPRFYAPEDMLVDAARRCGFTNVVDNRTGLKVDVSFIGDDSFLCSTLQRRVRSRIGSHPREFWFVTPEDVILMKLLWRKETRSQKQWENALSVARVKGTRMDWKYLFDQARNLDIEDDLTKLRDEAGI
jgi:hypothetical protein